MITPRRTRLVRVANLQSFRRVVVSLSLGDQNRVGPAEPSATPQRALEDADRRLVVVSTREAGRQLRRTIENGVSSADRNLVLPAFVTREQLYDRLWARLPNRPPRLSAAEREVMMTASAREAEAAGATPPFALRPGLIAEVVRFYDQLRRQGQSVVRFEELLRETLERDSEDRGAGRMLEQTRFLAATCREYERRRVASGRADEHALRDLLIEIAAPDPIRHIVITVGDWIAELDGLHRGDFDLLTRIPALDAIDLVATGELLASGFHQRVHEWLPEIDEIDGSKLGVSDPAVPALLAPARSTQMAAFVHRDREEELVAVARRIKGDGRSQDALDRTAVVFKRPLPYLYLAPSIFGGARIPYQAFDALPLAAEPFAAAVDVAIECVVSQFTRDTLVALLRSPHFNIAPEGAPVTREAIAALDRALSQRRYLGELQRLRQLASQWDGDRTALPGLAAAIAAADALQPLLEPAPASVQLRRFRSFLTTFGRDDDRSDAGGTEGPTDAAQDGAGPSEPDHSWDPRTSRARAAILDVLDALSDAFARHDDREVTIEEIAPDLRRLIGEETFAPGTGARGLQLVDARAARYGDYDEATLVGMIEGEWPDKPRANIFYSPGLLADLGWPSEKDRRGAARAAFIDLVRSPSQRVVVSTFTLDDEALVEPSWLIDDLSRAQLSVVEVEPPATQARVFVEEALSIHPPDLSSLDEGERAWASMRLARTAADDERYHGQAGTQPRGPLSVSAVETYLACPFKFFAQYVLRLDEEPEDEEVMDPRRQGQFIHTVFQSFFSAWQQAGRRAITAANLDEARALFATVVENHVARLPEAEAALERTRLLGSSVAEGLAEAVFRMEAERSCEVVERLLEHPLKGEFEFEGPGGRRTVALRGVADRLDLLEDGTVRLIDYKLSSAPSRSRALQLPIYGLCAEQRLAGHRGRNWTLGEAAYVTFRGPRRVQPLFGERANREEVLKNAQVKLLEAADGIERGAFPPTPDDVFLCTFCAFAAVCRQDYVGDV